MTTIASTSVLVLLVSVAFGTLGAVPASAAGVPSVSAVGSLAFKVGTDTTSLAVSPQHVGDLEVFFAKADATGVTVSSVSGGGVSTWTRAVSYSGYPRHDLEIWTGDVSTAGASTISVNFSASVGSTYTGLASQEFTASTGVNTAWSVDTTGGISNAASSVVTFPKLAPSGTGELYFSYDSVANTASPGSTPGFTYVTTSDGDIVTYDVNVSTAQQPTANQSPSGVSGGVAVLVAAAQAGSPPATPTVTSLSPSSGSIAGGTSVTVTGTNFTGATAVDFGSLPAASFTVTSATSLTARSPAGSGTVDVTVTTPAGVSPTGSGDTFTYVSASPKFSADSATPSASVGSSYSYTYAATGIPAPTFSVTSGALPPGLTLNSGSGLLSGVPTTASTTPYAFVVSASNSVGTVAGAPQSITVTNPVVIQRAATFPVNSESPMNSSISVNPQKVGDLMILSDQLHSTSIDVSAVSGGNSGAWHLAQQFIDTANNLTYQVWYAVATSTGASTITVTYSATTTLPVELIADSFTSSRAVTWSATVGGGVSNSTSATVVFPTLTSGTAPGELYWGASEEHGTGLAGTTPGFVYGSTSEANEYLYDASLAPNTAYSPTAGQTPDGVATSIGVIFSAQ